jgi:hypothetical protein
MSLMDDLHNTAISAATQAITPSIATGVSDPGAVARAAIEAATPYLQDVLRVGDALAARGEPAEPGDPTRRRPQRVRRTPAALWSAAGGDEHRYLDLMIEHGHLQVTTVDRFSVSEGGDTVAP